jgi:DNA repair exonuclease SbcCD ATPase subunit
VSPIRLNLLAGGIRGEVREAIAELKRRAAELESERSARDEVGSLMILVTSFLIHVDFISCVQAEADLRQAAATEARLKSQLAAIEAQLRAAEDRCRLLEAAAQDAEELKRDNVSLQDQVAVAVQVRDAKYTLFALD